MTSTPHLTLPLLGAAQAQKHVTHNEALAVLDALVHLAVKERDRTMPPESPEEGDRYLIGAGAGGAFENHDGAVGVFDAGAWRFLTPRKGWRLFVEAEDAVVVFDGTEWQDLGHYAREIDRLDQLGIGTTPDRVNRLSAKLNAALFAALGAEEGGTGDLRFVLSKSAAANVLSQLYQRNYSGRAETGLIGSDDFSIRVSPDGSQWRNALVVDAATGLAAFPSGLANLPGPNLLINSAFRINQRGFGGGTLTAGTFGFDRWKAGTGGCSLAASADGSVVLSGSIEQVIEVGQVAPALGLASLAGATLTLSVQDPSAALAVTVGSKSATIAAGTGRRSVSLTLGPAETGNITLRLQATGSCTFKRPKLELGAFATPWQGDPLDLEELRCRRYYQRLPVTGGTAGIVPALGQRVGATMIDLPVALPVSMRAPPTVALSAPSWANGLPVGNQIGFYDNVAGAWVTLTGAFSVFSASANGSSALVLRLQAGTAFSGAPGSGGFLHLGNSAAIAFSAEL